MKNKWEIPTATNFVTNIYGLQFTSFLRPTFDTSNYNYKHNVLLMTLYVLHVYMLM
jgi:hypothetical protein